MMSGPVDAVILAEFSLSFSLFSWLLAKRLHAVHIVDFFVGPYETHVEDRGAVKPRSFRGLAMRAIEWVAGTSADAILIDTDVRRASLVRRFGKTTITLPVGAPDWAHLSAPASHGGKLNMLYYGNYIPLHGLPAFVAGLAEACASLGDFHLTMIGEGDHRELTQRLVTESGLTPRVSFLEPVPEEVLADHIAASEIIVGIFGTSPKAMSVIANKVWQGLAANRIVVTRDAEALDELRDIARERLVVCPNSDARSIAGAIAAAATASRQMSDQDIGPGLEEYVRARYRALGAELPLDCRDDAQRKG